MKNQITLDDLKEFLLAAKVDLERQQQEFKEKNTSILEAVDKVDAFVKKHKDQIPKNKLIAVVEEGGNSYTFDPFAGVNEPDSLSEYLMRRDQYAVRLTDVDKALTLVEKLQTDTNAPANPMETLSILRILVLHKEYFNKQLDTNLSEEEKEKIQRQIAVLDMFGKLIKERFTQKDKRKLKITEE